MINAVYRHKPLNVYRGYVSGETRLPSSCSEYKFLKTFEFIKAVSNTVFDLINAASYDNPSIVIRAIRLS